jgi:diguanylate cyclase (GGDEF)-like protein
MFDLDHFKEFNDIHGHDAGDLVLMELGKFLFTQTRKEDIACRYGGEKFILILPGSNVENTCRRAEMLRESVEENLRISYHDKLLSGITISLGVSACPQNGCDPQFLISFADQALDEAKEEGRNRVKVATNTSA